MATETDPFTVCLLAMDKEDRSMYKLLKFNVSNGEERLITEVPYRKDCAIAFLKGEIYYRIIFVELTYAWSVHFR